MARIVTFIGIVAAALVFAGCGKKEGESSQTAASPASASSQSIAEPLVNLWEKGDRPGAISNFIKSDWKTGAVFEKGSVANLSEADFGKLDEADRATTAERILKDVMVLKQLAIAVVEAGRQAAEKGDLAQARKNFESAKQFGEALDKESYTKLVQLVGQGLKRITTKELAKLPPQS